MIFKIIQHVKSHLRQHDQPANGISNIYVDDPEQGSEFERGFL